MVGQQIFVGEATRLAYMTDEVKEGRNAFLEKRKPDFSDVKWLSRSLLALQRRNCASYMGVKTNMGEKVKRLHPKTKTLRELYLKSGNQCAFPECHNLMVNDEGIFIGQVCHIEAAEEGGERFNENQTNEQRRAFENLMLMCYEHHQVTNDVDQYRVPKLKRLKETHERKYGNIASKMRSSITDHTEVNEIYLPQNFARVNGVLNWILTDEESKCNVEEFIEYILPIKNIPIPTRELLVIILKRSELLSKRASEFGVSVSEIKHACDLDYQTLNEHLNILDNHGITINSYNFDGQATVIFRTTSNGWLIAQDIKEFSKKTDVKLTQLLVDLHFDYMD